MTPEEAEGFYEEDEPIEKIRAIVERNARPVITERPTGRLWFAPHLGLVVTDSSVFSGGVLVTSPRPA
jgi:hypothetical protein